VSHIMQVWREDGVPERSRSSLQRGIFLRVPAKRTWISFPALARRLHRFVPDCWRKWSLLLPLSPAADGARVQRLSGTFGMLTVDRHYNVQQPLAQFSPLNSLISNGSSPVSNSTTYSQPGVISTTTPITR